MLKFLRILIGAIFVVPLLVVTYVLYPVVMLLKRNGHVKAAEGITWCTLRFLVHAIMFFFGAKMHIVGERNIPRTPGRYCYIGNHTSMFDIVALMWPRGMKLSFVGKIEIRKIPIIRGWFKAIDAVYLDRKSPRQSIKAIIDGSRMIEAGVSRPARSRWSRASAARSSRSCARAPGRSSRTAIPFSGVPSIWSFWSRSRPPAWAKRSSRSFHSVCTTWSRRPTTSFPPSRVS